MAGAGGEWRAGGGLSELGGEPPRPVRALAAAARLCVRIYDPQARSGRLVFSRELALWCAAGLAAWLSLDPIADAEWISDEAVVKIAAALPWAAQLWSAALFSIAARRCHDLGLSGAWALLLSMPPVCALCLPVLLLAPGRSAGRAWPERAELLGALDA